MAEKREAVASDTGFDRPLQPTNDTDHSRQAPGPRYHVVVTGADGARSLQALAAYGDDEAIARALALAEGRTIEIWDGPRLIAHVAAAAR